MKRKFQCFLSLFLISGTLSAQDTNKASIKPRPFLDQDYNLINQTFLGNFERNYYGNEAPDTLIVLWKHYLGKGKTTISRKKGDREWAGAGWTGQPLMVQEDSNLYLIQGAYDHNLKKLDASTGNLIWQYKFNDVIKGTGTIWEDPLKNDPGNSLVILQGSRLGYGKYLDEKHIPSYRAISYFTGKELWRLDIKWTKSYSRDVDGSALIHKDTAYLAFENSLFTKFNPDYRQARKKNGMLQPSIYSETRFYSDFDVKSHGGNIVSESSPCILDSVIYTASGSGHIFGYSLRENEITWDFYIGSDIDGSALVTHDSCLIVTVEKQYIDGQGGVFKLDPRKKPGEAVIWYFPTGNVKYAGWEGGVIGSASVNHHTKQHNHPHLAAFNAIDGYLYIVDHTSIDNIHHAIGPNLKNKYPTPKLIYKFKTGASISTPLIIGNKVISAGYGGLYLFSFDDNLDFKKICKHGGTYESTPFVHDRKIYVASRNGYFYCLGE